MKSVFRPSRPARDGETRSALDLLSNHTPATDWNFQASSPFTHGGGGAGSFRRHTRPSFRFFDAEGRREDRVEATGFVLIVALAVWPMVQAAHAMLHLIK